MTSELKISIPEDATTEITEMFIASARSAFDELIQQQAYPPYLNQKQSAKYLNLSVSSFTKLHIPRVVLEGVERYSRATLDQYCKQHEF